MFAHFDVTRSYYAISVQRLFAAECGKSAIIHFAKQVTHLGAHHENEIKSH